MAQGYCTVSRDNLGNQYAGSVQATALDGLADLYQDSSVDYQITVDFDEDHGLFALHVQLRGILHLVCVLCNGELDYNVACTQTVFVLGDSNLLSQYPSVQDVFIAPRQRVYYVDFVNEQVQFLLPAHPQHSCCG